ncbi:pickpocket protein 28-like [Topomyia yanbarensis]|uniref:pickpocket protein 28-like n=1 Tax=Topomyia yanbarensis TaxID=2498891 RepID=UPI00273ADB93|nr:pickpocket protein 28-like [Topomyia yanbarensis]
MTADAERRTAIVKNINFDENGKERVLQKVDEDVESRSPSETGESMFRQFIQKSSFYGLRYVLDNDSKLVENLLWLMVILTAIGFCAVGIILSWWRLVDQVVEIVQDEDPSPIWSVPFPAVSICGQWNAAVMDERKTSCLERTVPLERFCEQVCWHNQCDICRSLFTETRTENGVCYTFNNIAAGELFNQDLLAPELILSNATKSTENWNLHDGYADYGVFLKYYPRPAVDLSEKYRLRMKLKFNESFVDSGCGDSGAIRVFLHNPVDFPYKGRNAVLIKSGEFVDISAHPVVKQVPQLLKYYPSSSAKCYFSEQRQLRYFRIYSQHNCELECRINYFLEKKKCALSYMPREAGNKLCKNSFHWDDHFDKEALLTIRYGWLDFIANAGGIIALLLGISVITVIEMIYYCTLKPLLA